MVFVCRQFSCQLLCTISGKYVRECLGKIGDLSVEFPTGAFVKEKDHHGNIFMVLPVDAFIKLFK